MVSRISARPLVAVAALLALAACQDSPTGLTPDAAAGARSPQAQDRLEAVFQRISGDVMGSQGAVFIDNDERIGKVVVGVSDVGAARGVQNAMARLGVAAGDYEVELTSPIEFKATLQNARFSSGVAGMQVHFTQYVCSLGANVDHAGGRGFIINSHCTGTQGGVENTQYYQPSSSAYPTAIATEAADPVYSRNLPGCAKGKVCRYSDASRAVYAASYPSSRGTIAKTTALTPNTGNLTVDETGSYSITAQDNDGTLNKVGVVVNKVGRTTGWTRGTINRTCVNTAVSASKIMQLCQSFVSDPAGGTVVSGGDSGSGVWVDNGTGVTLVGLLWGGSSDNKTFIFSPLKQVQQELGTVNAVK